MAIIRLWFFTLKPNASFSDPAFLKLWADVLELCARYTTSPGPSSSFLSQPCPEHAHHFLFESTSSRESTASLAQQSVPEPVFVLICSYPSFALCTQADLVYATRFHARMAEYVQHRALRQLDMEDAEAVPTLLASSRRRKSSGGVDAGADQGDQQPTVTVAISNTDPLVAEAMSSSTASLSGTKLEVPPPHMEISGADVYTLPPASIGGGGQRDASEAQSGQERKWIRISRGGRSRMEKIDVELYQLKELMAQ